MTARAAIKANCATVVAAVSTMETMNLPVAAAAFTVNCHATVAMFVTAAADIRPICSAN
jgi:hypothetical protein